MGPQDGQLVFVKWSKTEVFSQAKQERYQILFLHRNGANKPAVGNLLQQKWKMGFFNANKQGKQSKWL